MLLPKGIDKLPEPLTEVDLTPIRLLAEHMAEASRVVETTLEPYRRLAKTAREAFVALQPAAEALAALQPLIQLPTLLFRFPPQLEHLLGASRGDREAARWLAENMHWEPDASTTKLLTLHARINRQTPEQIWVETLTDAFLNILRNRETLLVFHVCDGGPIITPEGGPFTAKIGELSIPFLYKWVQTEAVRHALNILMGAPCSLQVILERQPAEGEDEIDLLAWPGTSASLILPSANLGGRPSGSTVMSMESFTEEYGQAYYRLLARDRIKRPTQVDLAAELFISPVTLRNYLKKLGLPWPPG